MNLVTRTTEYPTGVVVTETFDSVSDDAPFDQFYGEDAKGNTEIEAVEVEPFVLTFVYHGKYREVSNPQVVQGRWDNRTGYNALLGGVELETGQYKNFNLSEIRPVQ